jgi:HD-like signal output (HDOD) protein
MPQIAAEITRDPPLAVQVLRIANSAHYGLAEPVMDIKRAAMVLGIRTLHDIVLRAAVITEFQDVVAHAAFSLEGLWRHSIFTGELAHTLSGLCQQPLKMGPSDFYACGLVHDVGRVILLDSRGEEYAAVLRESRAKGVPSSVMEEQRFGFNHSQVGSVVAFMWKLPKPLQDAIEYHHGPRSRVEANSTVALVSLCDHIAKEIEEGAPLSPSRLSEHPACSLVPLPMEALELVAVNAKASFSRIEVW